MAELLDTYERMTESVRRIAAEQFAGHRIERLDPGEWRCGKADTGSYGFRVIVRPGTVIVYGDIGHGIFRGGEAGDTLAWLRQAVSSPRYLMEKLRPARAWEHFYADDALARAREGAADGERVWLQVLAEAERMRQHGELDQHTWADLVAVCGGDCDSYSVGLGYPPEAFWLASALRWFAEHLPEGGASCS